MISVAKEKSGGCRIIYSIQEQVLIVLMLKIGHRRDI